MKPVFKTYKGTPRKRRYVGSRVKRETLIKGRAAYYERLRKRQQTIDTLLAIGAGIVCVGCLYIASLALLSTQAL